MIFQDPMTSYYNPLLTIVGHQIMEPNAGIHLKLSKKDAKRRKTAIENALCDDETFRLYTKS